MSVAPRSMRAVQMAATGGPEVLRLTDLPVPTAGPHDVLVRVHAAGVGKPDILVRTGRYAWMPRFPAIIGIESAGVVEQVGAQVKGFAPGDTVYVNARDLPERSGGYAEYRLAPAESVHRLPAGCDLVRAAALGNFQVAECLLRMAGAFPPAHSVAIFGAAGGVGSATIQLAALRKWQVLAVASNSERGEFALKQGATHFIDSSRTDVVNGIQDLTAGQGVDLVLDIASGQSLPRLFSALAPMGVVVSYGFLEGEPGADTAPAMRRAFGKSPGWRLFSMHALDTQAALRREVTAGVISAFASGRITPAIHARFPLEQVQAAHTAFERGGLLGKIVLTVGPTAP
jgi:NADPH2:quinone reductase